MRATFFMTLLFAAYASAATLWYDRRQSTPPACAAPCLDTSTNGVSQEGCAHNNFACLCASQTYVQGVINCFAIYCASHDDVVTAIQYSTGFCGVAGVNQQPSVTTPTAQLSPTTAASNNTASSTSPAPSSSSRSASTGAASSLQAPTVLVGALALLAAGMTL